MLVDDDALVLRGSLTTPVGRIGVVVCHGRVVEVRFRVTGNRWTVQSRGDRRSELVMDQALTQLGEYFAGSRQKFTVPTSLNGTDFQVETWKTLSRVPFGRTVSYKEQATLMGRPTAMRAVGAANGRNPIPVIYPCHRVVGANGTLTGFSGGLKIKKWLLAHESAVSERSRTTVRS